MSMPLAQQANVVSIVNRAKEILRERGALNGNDIERSIGTASNLARVESHMRQKGIDPDLKYQTGPTGFIIHP